jgi:hypothetical protein
VSVERLGKLAIAALAVVALATVAASLDTVSTQPTITSDSPNETPTPPDREPGGGGGQGGDPDGETERQTATESTATPATESERQLPLWQVLGGLGLFLVGCAVALYALTDGVDGEGRAEKQPPVTESVEPPADSVTLGTDLPASNDVYRAWNALCADVPIDPAGQTPAAVAEAAVEAGYPPGPVAELTGTFCEVRYGDAEPTDDRERRARELAATLSPSTPGAEDKQ